MNYKEMTTEQLTREMAIRYLEHQDSKISWTLSSETAILIVVLYAAYLIIITIAIYRTGKPPKHRGDIML